MSRPLPQTAILDREETAPAIRPRDDAEIALLLKISALGIVAAPASLPEPRARAPELATPCVRGVAAARHTALRQRMRSLARAARRLGRGA